MGPSLVCAFPSVLSDRTIAKAQNQNFCKKKCLYFFFFVPFSRAASIIHPSTIIVFRSYTYSVYCRVMKKLTSNIDSPFQVSIAGQPLGVESARQQIRVIYN